MGSECMERCGLMGGGRRVWWREWGVAGISVSSMRCDIDSYHYVFCRLFYHPKGPGGMYKITVIKKLTLVLFCL